MTYSAAFQLAVKGVLAREGGYVHDASDPGGETDRGLSRRQYADLDLPNLTDEQATAIYWRDYWSALSCDQLPAVVAAKLFDCAVNCGHQQAMLILQRAANDLGAHLHLDGWLGPVTRTTVMGMHKTALVCAMAARQYERYADLIRRNPALRKFAAGWAIRAMACLPREQS